MMVIVVVVLLVSPNHASRVARRERSNVVGRRVRTGAAWAASSVRSPRSRTRPGRRRRGRALHGRLDPHRLGPTVAFAHVLLVLRRRRRQLARRFVGRRVMPRRCCRCCRCLDRLRRQSVRCLIGLELPQRRLLRVRSWQGRQTGRARRRRGAVGFL